MDEVPMPNPAAFAVEEAMRLQQPVPTMTDEARNRVALAIVRAVVLKQVNDVNL